MKKLLTFFYAALLCSAAGAQESLYDTDQLSKDFHQQRREALRDKLPANSVAVFFAAPTRNRANDVDFLYHQDPNFFYLTGYDEPNGLYLMFKEEQTINGVTAKDFLYIQDRDPQAELWNGRRLGKDGVEQKLNYKGVFINSEFKKVDLDFRKFDKVLFPFMPKGVVDDTREEGDLADLITWTKEKTGYPKENTDLIRLNKAMAELRQQKLPEELKLMRKACSITCEAFNEVMKALEPGFKEYQAQAIAEYYFKANGSEYPGYPSIVGGGENSCILHYETNRKKLTSKDLLLVDVGAEYHGYTADVTRTMPVDGKFSTEEKAIYELVLKAQQAGIDATLKGNSFQKPDQVAREIITKGLIELGIIADEKEARQYFPHGTSHYLGLDVHDVGTYSPLQPGQVITVEPGIYIPDGSPCDKKWWNIGVRIEDDILVTETGNENMSACIPRSVSEIEALMKQESIFNKKK